jgi:hypothetical protein
LPEALASIFAQTLVPSVLVSFAPASAYSSSWPLRVNALLPAITTPYFALLGDDDLMLPSYVERVTRAAAETNADVISTDCEEFGNAHGRFHGGAWTLDGFRKTTPVWVATAIRTDLVRALGGFDASLLYQDWDLWYRAFKSGATRSHIPEVLWRWRSHGAMQGTSAITYEAGRDEIWRKHPELATDGEPAR